MDEERKIMMFIDSKEPIDFEMCEALEKQYLKKLQDFYGEPVKLLVLPGNFNVIDLTPEKKEY